MSDYYQVLQLNRTATIDDIKKSFRKLSLKYHPTKNPADITVCSDQFHQICEAYEVLSDLKSRTVYDSYGAEVLSRGLHRVHGSSYPGYKYKRNAFEIFEKFYREYLPYHEIFDDKGKDLYGSCFGYAFGGILNNQKYDFQPQDIHVELECTLEELYNGCMKEIIYKRHIVNLDSQVIEEEILKNVEIKPGYTDGFEINIKNEGDLGFYSEKRDLIVHLKQLSHKKFARRGKASQSWKSDGNANDLVYTHDVKLVDALNASSVKFKTLDNRFLTVAIDEIITPQVVILVENEGMPIYDQKEEEDKVIWTKKGKLYIRFNILFPQNLTEEKKKKVAEILNISSV